jgi:hypothetical protein
LAHVVSSLAYPNLLGTKRLGCCCCFIVFSPFVELIFLSSFVFSLLFRHYFISVSLTHVVSSLTYPNLLGTKAWLLLLICFV